MSEENKKKLNEQLIKCLLDDNIPTNIKLRKMDYIIRLGADVNARYENGFSVLVLAKTIGNDEVVSFLEERGANDIGFDSKKAEEFFKSASVEEINKVLKVLPDGYELDCDVNLSGRGLTELPDFSRIVVNGEFDCDNNKLTTLKGAPKEVKRGFYCNKNQLISLEGSPSIVGGAFYCFDNQLISLEGSPSIVGWGFYCYDNPLKSYKGKPDKIGGEFRAPKIELGRKIYNILTRGGDRNE